MTSPLRPAEDAGFELPWATWTAWALALLAVATLAALLASTALRQTTRNDPLRIPA